MKQRMQEELIQRQLPENKINFIVKQSHCVLCKLFQLTNEIWLVHKKWEDINTIVQELLHSM